MPGKLRNKFMMVPVTVVLPALMLGVLSSGQAVAQGQPNTCQTFQETGQTVCGKFLDYWKNNGNLAQQGFPVSAEMQEKSDIDGKTYTVQYFERAVFESHPENKAPHDILLQLLGSMRLKEKYPSGVRELPDDARAEAGMTFPETGKTVKGPFLDYWKNNGGVAQQGFPITNLVREKSDIDGKEYIMQYFERAVFELHPENKAPYNVLLSQLGTMRYKMKYSATGGTGTLLTGDWGGEHIGFSATDKGAYIEFDCAHVIIDTPISIANGKFSVPGKFIQESGVQMDPEMMPPPQPATITGTVTGTTLSITVTVTGDRQLQIGPLTATRGKDPFLRKCM